MRNFIVLVMLLSLSVGAMAQCDEDNQVRKLFDEGSWEKCIKKADKAINKNNNNIGNYFLMAKANLELWNKGEGDEAFLKVAIKTVGKALKKEKEKNCVTENMDFVDLLKEATKDHAAELFGEEKTKNKSRFFYHELAKVFADTVNEYYVFYPKKKSGKGLNAGENKVVSAANFTDNQGRKQGLWRKVFQNGNIAYELTFRDNVPVGDYKRFHENGKIKAHLIYDQMGKRASASLFNKNGQKVAEGFYLGKQRDSLWVFFDEKDRVVARENYKDGKRYGKSVKYYENGNPSEERNFVDGIENGVWKQFYEDGQKELEARIVKDKRDGPFYKYYKNGSFRVKGYYKDNLMDGEWTYYDRSGKAQDTVLFERGEPKTGLEKLEEEQRKYFEELSQNKGRIIDPEDYLNNPYEYSDKVRRGQTIK